MIKSMTGYGRGECATEARKFTVEVRSLNGKSLDLSLRTPSSCRSVEQDLRSAATRVLLRGKVDMNVAVENLTAVSSTVINRDLFRAYYRELVALSREVAYEIDDEPLMQTILRMPDVVAAGEREQFSAEDVEALMTACTNALEAIDAFRMQEGAVLIADMLKRVETIQELLPEVEKYEVERIATVRERLSDNLSRAQVVVDNNRFEAEIIYFLEKFDVTEEKVRLAQHINYFREVVADGGDAGRKLGFIAQEMGREINTLGSKANHHEIQRIVVRMKDELEKIKEQLLNIL